MKKPRGRRLDQSESEKRQKTICLETKNFHKTLVVGGCGSGEGGRLVGGRLGQRSRLGQLGG